MKKIIFALVLAAAAAAGTWQYRHGMDHAEDAAAQPVLYGNMDVRQVSLAFDGTARVAGMLAEEGDRVVKGQVLAVQDVRTLELQAAVLEADIEARAQALLKMRSGNRAGEIAQADAARRAASASLDQARRDEARMDAMRRSSSVSRQDWENTHTALLRAQAALDEASARADLMHEGFRAEDVAQAEAQLASAKAQLASVRHSIGLGTLRAPCDAVVSSRVREPGDMAGPSSPVYLLTITSPKWMRAYATERQLGLIRPGMEAEVFCDSFPAPVKGRVGYISPTAEFTPKSVQTEELRTALLYEVRIVVEDGGDRLRLGMPVTARLKP